MVSKELFLECYKALDEGLESPNVKGDMSKLTSWGLVYSVTEEEGGLNGGSNTLGSRREIYFIQFHCCM